MVLLRRRLQGVYWTGMDVVTGIAVLAYADDASVMVTSERWARKNSEGLSQAVVSRLALWVARVPSVI